MKKDSSKINRRPESRTFDPSQFHRIQRFCEVAILLVMLGLWIALRGISRNVDFSTLIVKALIFVVGVWLLILAREGLRALLMHFLAGARWEFIRFGIFWSRGGAVFTKCMAVVDASRYIWATLIPDLALGWIPWLICLFLGDLWIYSAFAILSAGTFANIRVLWRLLRLPRGSWVQDSPFAPGCDVYIPEG